MSKKTIYLDNHATTKVADDVREEWDRIVDLGPLNPSSVHAQGQVARNELTRARRLIAQALQVQPSQILFTSGATEGLNLAIRSVLSEKPLKIISTKTEHSAVFKTLEDVKTQGAQVTYLPVDKEGKIDLEDLKRALPADLIVLSYANSETGVRLDLDQICSLLENSSAHFVLDGVTWMGKDKVQIPKRIDCICFSGHKFHAPQGVGFLYYKSSFPLRALLTGGGQESDLRSGTPNLPGIVALAKATQIAQEGVEEFQAHMRSLQERFEEGIKKIGVPYQIHGKDRLCSVVNVYFDGIDGEGLFMQLDLHGVCVSLGSACSSGSLEPSRILVEMGVGEKAARSSLRFSWSRYTTQEEIDTALEILEKLVVTPSIT